jgi:hypothetical protein
VETGSPADAQKALDAIEELRKGGGKVNFKNADVGA